MFRNKICFDREELLALHPTPKLEDHTLSAVRNFLFNIFSATLQIGGRSSIRNLRMCHAMVTGTHLPHGFITFLVVLCYIHSTVLSALKYSDVHHNTVFVSILLLKFIKEDASKMLYII